MKLYPFDDRRADGWAPFALTRPCGELRFGAWTLRERLERFCGVPAAGTLTRPWLAGFREMGAPPVVSCEAIDPATDRLFLCVRFVPDLGGSALPEARLNLWTGDLLVGARLLAGDATPDAEWFAAPWPLSDAEDLRLEGLTLGEPWDLVAGNAARLDADLRAIAPADEPTLPQGVERLGDGPLTIGEEVTLEPGVLLDTRSGPIRLGDQVEVRAGTRLEAPLDAGPHSRLLGGSIAALSAGPHSYLRGEVEESIVLGYANKAHDGFLGHAIVGRWVNLGALTTNSDLKNNYRSIRVGPPGAEVDTGLLKFGSLIGDHVKTGIGLLLNTGTVVGAGSNLFGAAMPPRWVPPFSWGSGESLVEHRREAFLESAVMAMSRRGVAADEPTLEWLGAVWDRARSVIPS